MTSDATLSPFFEFVSDFILYFKKEFKETITDILAAMIGRIKVEI